METQPINVNRDDLAKFIKEPRTIRAFENLASNQTISTDIVTAIQDAAILGVTTSDVFTSDRFLNGSSDIMLTDGGPKGPLSVSLTPSGVSAGNYGDASHLIQIAVDSKGRISLVASYILDSDNVAEGAANLFFTTARARASVGAGTGLSYTVGTGVFAIDNAYIAAGPYTPTVAILANVTADTPHICYYQRIGNIVSVTGALEVTPTTAGLYCNLTLSLPIASNFTVQDDAWGTMTGNSVAAITGAIVARAGDDTVQLSYVGPSTSSHYVVFEFKYRILP